MSFSRSRKAARQARISGDTSHLYSLEDDHVSELCLWREPSHLDLTLNVPSRPQRVYITDGESMDECCIQRQFVVEARPERLFEKGGEEMLESRPFCEAPHDKRASLTRTAPEIRLKWREIAILTVICMVQILPLSALGCSFPTTEIVATSFNITEPSILTWTVAAYALTFSTFILIAGRLGDIAGHKKVIIIGFVIMTFSSLLSGLSKYSTYTLYIIARALQGMGSAFMQPNGLALLSGMYPANSKKKNLAFALFGAMAAPGAYLGMVFGALLAQGPSWAWVFYATAITSAVCAISAYFVLISPLAPPHNSSFCTKLQALDWGGAITGVTALTCTAIAWVQAPSLGWDTQYIYMLLLIGIITASGFILIELRVATYPLVPLRNLSAHVAFILAAAGLGWASFGTDIFYIWQFLLHPRQLLPVTAAIQLLPVVPMGFVANLATGLLMQSAKPSAILLISLLAFTTAAILMYSTPPAQTYWSLTFASLLLVPFGMDMSFPAATVTISNALPSSQQGIAGSLVATVVNYSMSLGLGIASTAEYYVSKSDSSIKNMNTASNYQPAFLVAIVLGALGTFLSVIFLGLDLLNELRRADVASNGTAQDTRGVIASKSAFHNWGLMMLKGRIGGGHENKDKMQEGGEEQNRRQREQTWGYGGSADNLWAAHPAVRPLDGVELIARD